MTPTMIGVSIFIAAAGAAGIVWFQRRRGAASARRRDGMMARVGMDFGTEPFDAPRKRALMTESRRRCMECSRDSHCDRWLAGEVEGDSAFCPNAQTFRNSVGTNIHNH